MSDREKLKFSENLSSRLCHDLITPMGAINTGLELLNEQEDFQSQEAQEIMDLIRLSAQTSTNRLGFYRVAFGTSGQNISLGDAQRLIGRYFEKSKMDIQWTENMDPQLALPTWGRLLINAVMWVGECAPRGGTMTIVAPEKGREELEIHLHAPQIVLHEGILEAITGKIQYSDLSPRTIHSCLLRLVALNIGCVVKVEQPHLQELTLKISQKKP